LNDNDDDPRPRDSDPDNWLAENPFFLLSTFEKFNFLIFIGYL